MRGGLGALFAIAFLGALVWFSTTQSQVECEACMRFEGREACNTSAAATREEAEAQARSSACARVSAGVTAGIQCSQQLNCSPT